MLPKKHVCVENLKQFDLIGAKLKTGYENDQAWKYGSFVFLEHLLN